MASNPSPIQKFKPITDKPEVIALTKTEGYPTHSDYNGDQLMYTLVDGRKWFADLYVGERIREAGIQARENFEVNQTETRHGNRRTVTVGVRRLGLAEQVNGAVSSCQSSTAPSSSQHQTSNGSMPSHPTPVPMNGKGETGAQQLTRCYRDAVDIALMTVAYAKDKGVLLSPEFGDIRALAATLAINEQGGRR